MKRKKKPTATALALRIVLLGYALAKGARRVYTACIPGRLRKNTNLHPAERVSHNVTSGELLLRANDRTLPGTMIVSSARRSSGTSTAMFYRSDLSSRRRCSIALRDGLITRANIYV